MAKVTLFKFPLDAYIMRYIEGDEDISSVVYTGDLQTAKNKLRQNLYNLIEQIDSLKLKELS